jgi:hypothetical protein
MWNSTSFGKSSSCVGELRREVNRSMLAAFNSASEGRDVEGVSLVEKLKADVNTPQPVAEVSAEASARHSPVVAAHVWT